MGRRGFAEFLLGQHIGVVCGVLMCGFFGTAFVNSLNWALVPDTVDYGEWKTGIRAEGSVYTGYTFSRKISAALAGFLPGIMLTQIGYIPNIAQSSGTLLGLRQLMFIWPGGLAVIAAVTMSLFYKLNEQRFARIIEELSQRKNLPRNRKT
ncbi:MFS transporter [Mangrovibacter sp. SLW1]